MTAAGPVRVERTLYKDRTDEAGRAISPMELSAGIVAGFWTPVAAKQAARMLSQMTPQTAEELFARVRNMAPSKSSLDRLPKALAQRWDDDRSGCRAFAEDARPTALRGPQLAVRAEREASASRPRDRALRPRSPRRAA
jgi:hypothetical protein